MEVWQTVIDLPAAQWAIVPRTRGESRRDRPSAEPQEPAGLADRAAESWEPLLAIAELAGGDWPARARQAALALSGSQEAEAASLGALLLGAIRETFGAEDRLPSTTLVARINEDDELPFGGWRDGKGLDTRKLARMLKPYGIRPNTVWLGDGSAAKGSTAKGYLREAFGDAWARWLPPTPQEPSGASEASGDRPDVREKPHEQANLTDITDLTDAPGLPSDNASLRQVTVEGEERAAQPGVTPYDDSEDGA